MVCNERTSFRLLLLTDSYARLSAVEGCIATVADAERHSSRPTDERHVGGMSMTRNVAGHFDMARFWTINFCSGQNEFANELKKVGWKHNKKG